MDEFADDEDPDVLRKGVYTPDRRFGISCEFGLDEVDNRVWFHLQVRRRKRSAT